MWFLQLAVAEQHKHCALCSTRLCCIATTCQHTTTRLASQHPPVVDTAGVGPANDHSMVLTGVRVTMGGPALAVIVAASAAPVAAAFIVTIMLPVSKSASVAVCVRVQVVLLLLPLPAGRVVEPQELTVPELPLKLKLDSVTLPVLVTVTDAEHVKLPPAVCSTSTLIVYGPGRRGESGGLDLGPGFEPRSAV